MTDWRRPTRDVALAGNDVYPDLDERGGLILTGATGTKLNDLRVPVVD